MSEELYLIAHKVRGEPAFDIAIKATIGDEEGWIVPTSGHRAYPLDTQKLDNLGYASEWLATAPTFNNWSNLPDHYAANTPRDLTPLTARVTGLLSVLGLGPKPIKRRSVT